MKTLINLAGHKFGKWMVNSMAGRNAAHESLWQCACDCGTQRVVRSTSLRDGTSTSCGCLRRKHGHSLNNGSPTYKSWRAMITRCSNPRTNRYKYYGAVGIRVCERWLEFESFLEDMGARPRGMSLDRFPDNSGNYEQDNCRWATPKQQANNRRKRIY